ncbi:MAG: FecR domain-containing protein, partial [Bacteroidales bacterium]|nr:FecR domain-containing protein [Bacteroidales bacterium]
MKWIFNPDSLTEKYWEKYLQEHPEEEYYISQLKEDLHLLKLKNEDFSEEEKKILLQSILKRKDQPAKVVKFRKVANKLMRYAAVAILFLIIGNAIMYLYLNNKPKSIDFAALDYNLPVDKPTLFLPDGSDIKLDNTSTIEYNTENKIIVDDKVVEIAENDKDEVIFNHAIIPYGSRSKITLADNTVVHLNAGSKLIYPSVFKNNKREVVLFGEAFFEVTKNKEKPFIVKTTSLSIEVLGTKFNVSSYFEDNIIQTVLVEGEVSVKRNDAPFYEKSIILKPDQMLTFNKKT